MPTAAAAYATRNSSRTASVASVSACAATAADARPHATTSARAAQAQCRSFSFIGRRIHRRADDDPRRDRISPRRRLVVLEELPPHVRTGELPDEDRIDDARGA